MPRRAPAPRPASPGRRGGGAPALPRRLLLCLTLTAGCTFPTDSAPRPPATMRPFLLTGADPADGAGDVATNAALRLRFSDFPDPGTLAAVALRGGGKELRCPRDLSRPQPGELPCEVELLRREIVLRPAALLPVEAHEIELGAELRSLSGAALPAPQVLRLRTGMGTVMVTPPAPLRLADVLGDVGGLRARCALPACHRAAAEQPAARYLDLLQPEDALRKALLQPALGSPEGLALVEPGRPERSYLLRTVLAWDGFLRVESDPMPPPPSERLTDDRIQAINDWIRQGAP